jgi:hypothetical protein
MIIAVFDPTARDETKDIDQNIWGYIGFSIVFPNLSPTLAMYYGLDPIKFSAKGFTMLVHKKIMLIGFSMAFNYISMLTAIVIVLFV